MTREEHIYQLKQYLQGKSISMCPASSLYWQEHWEEVIKALEQEPTTKNDLGVDCIDRNSIKYYPGTGGYMYASKGEIDKLPSVTPQEQELKPMVEIDLYSVIKQKYIEREVLDKIRVEIESLERFEIRGEKTPLINGDNVLHILDKYKAEREQT